jgi:hypothetical protein
VLTAIDVTATVAAAGAAASAACAVMSHRWLARARELTDGRGTAAQRPVLHDAAIQLRYLRALSVVGVTLEAMHGILVRADETPVFGNVVPPIAELAELRDAATALGRTLDVGILTATVYWLREHWYQRSFVHGSSELYECRARVDAALWETRRLMGIAADATLPRTLADVETLAELAAPAPAVGRTRGRRVAARREPHVETHVAMQAASAG